MGVEDVCDGFVCGGDWKLVTLYVCDAGCSSATMRGAVKLVLVLMRERGMYGIVSRMGWTVKGYEGNMIDIWILAYGSYIKYSEIL